MPRGKRKSQPETVQTKESPKKPKRSEACQSLLDEVRAKYIDKMTLIPASELQTCDDLRRPTGLTSLDIKLGGGWPAGRMSMLSGLPGVGKDFIINHTIAEIQKNYGDKTRVVVASFGADLDVRFAQTCGAMIPMSDRDIALLEEENGEPFSEELRRSFKQSIGEVYVVKYGQSEEVDKSPAAWMGEFLLDCLKTKAFQLIVLNEMGSQMTRARLETDVKAGDKRQTADAALFFDDFAAKYEWYMKQSSKSSPNETTLLLASQMRTHFGYGMSAYQDSIGGLHIAHTKSIELRMKHGSPMTSNNQVVGKSVEWKIVKGKHGISDGAEGEYEFRFGSGVNLTKDLVKTAVTYDLIRHSSSDFAWRDIKAIGWDKFIAALQEAGKVDALKAEVFKRAGLAFRVR